MAYTPRLAVARTWVSTSVARIRTGGLSVPKASHAVMAME